ncbi:MAG TPA: DNA mismatch repair protein MutS, partial [Polyangiaceae bacterium]|nr:DNA mismatch repair protein MutS [Polyangiaceae bacterium]
RKSGSRGRTDEPLSVWGEAPAELPTSAAAKPPASSRRGFVLAARALVPLTAVLFLGRPWLVLVHPRASLAWLVPFIAQMLVLGLLYGPIARMVSVVSSREAPFGRFRAVFARVEGLTPKSARLVKIVAALRGDGAPASVEIARLERIVGFADLRHNTLVHLVVNFAFLYDVWVALALERWRGRSGRRARGWITALGELEALASIATYAGEHPAFSWPEVDDGEAHLDAEALGHPLIAANKRVVNDASLPSPGRAFLVTGSNMSGKSTFLRSLGLATVMAFAGLPICATRLRVARVETWTSMRVGDALDQGMSHFMAELVRLKSVVVAAQAGKKVLFLLDEILHGTNSRERTIGARGVVMDLVRHGAIGGVSTHDFALVSIADESDGKVQTVHFSDRIEGGAMLFDYTLKRGVVQSTNAIRLMKVVGIDVAYETSPPEETGERTATSI